MAQWWLPARGAHGGPAEAALPTGEEELIFLLLPTKERRGLAWGPALRAALPEARGLSESGLRH